jgi:putative endonuclease
MTAYVYILRCSDVTLYVGSTRNLEVRLYQHQIGAAAAYTRNRRPVTLVWMQEYENVGEAFGREKQLQNWSRQSALR